MKDIKSFLSILERTPSSITVLMFCGAIRCNFDIFCYFNLKYEEEGSEEEGSEEEGSEEEGSEEEGSEEEGSEEEGSEEEGSEEKGSEEKGSEKVVRKVEEVMKKGSAERGSCTEVRYFSEYVTRIINCRDLEQFHGIFVFC
jgi:hypothetical protein